MGHTPGDLPVLDVDGLEHRLVEATAHGRSSLQVRRLAVAGELDRGSEDVLPTVEVRLCDVELLLRRPLLRGDAILLILQELKWDGVRAVVSAGSALAARERTRRPGRIHTRSSQRTSGASRAPR